MKRNNKINRRGFLQLSGVVAGGMLIKPWKQLSYLEDFPQAARIGRIAEAMVEVRAQPNIDAASVGKLYEDAVVVCEKEVIGYNPYRVSQRWMQTPQGYIWSPLIQPVKNTPTAPLTVIPEANGAAGMWVEVCVPYVDVRLYFDAPYAPSVKYAVENNDPIRMRYSQVLWVDEIMQDETGQVWYHISEPYGSYGDEYWGPAEAFRCISPEEITPISPEVEEKRIEVDVTRQTVSCFEGEREVFFAKMSSGKVGESETPPGEWYQVWRKMVSVHMSGGTTGGGYDLAGIGWTTLFMGDGIAIHSTFWHNNFGERMSHGCINVSPEHAKYIWRWANPIVEYDPGDKVVTDYTGTRVRVIE